MKHASSQTTPATVLSNGSPKANGAAAADPRNQLNDLTGPQWLPETKSFFFQKGLGADHPHAQIERLHPAPFSYQDVQRLVAFFTKHGHTVLDPFSGVGSTAKACARIGRNGIGIELSPRWHQLAIERFETEVEGADPCCQRFIHGDAREKLTELPDNSVHFVVTSPPYWSILNKKPDHKAMERVEQNLETKYSDNEKDLANIADYGHFLDELAHIFLSCGRVLKPKRYMAIIVSDFRHGSKFHAFHADLIRRIDEASVEPAHRLELKGVKVLLQNQKSLKPYGYPFAYVENIHHQYILIFAKVKA